MSDSVKYLLDEGRMPKFWYTVAADPPAPLPPVLHPGTLQPIGPADLEPLFPMALILQAVSTERRIEIPDPVRDVYRQRRPTPLFGARRLEKTLQTPARIYYKYEGVSPAGSHKPNTAVAQAFYNKEAGVKKIATETGAANGDRRWPSRARSSVSRSWSSGCASRPTRNRIGGRSWKCSAPGAYRARRPKRTLAARFSRFPFIGEQLRGGKKTRISAVEPTAYPSLTRGKYTYDFGDTGHMTPLTKMHTLGSTFMPPGFHAGGLPYHGMAPLLSHLKELGRIEAVAPKQNACFEAGVTFARAEGIIPAPEANHAVRGAIDEAIRCREEGVSRAILFNRCGHGHFDMQAYMDYFAGKLTDQTYDEKELAMALAGLPSVPASSERPTS